MGQAGRFINNLVNAIRRFPRNIKLIFNAHFHFAFNNEIADDVSAFLIEIDVDSPLRC